MREDASPLERFRAALGPEPAALLDRAARTARRRDVAAYVVGGAVRDWMLGVGVTDLDIAVVDDAAAFARAMAEGARASVVSFERFGTARVVTAGGSVDVATVRSESYARPGALPSARPAATIDEDLARRDFSINAMAIPVHGDPRALVDAAGGATDLQQRRLRVLHPASFVDDPTRLFRAVRLATRFSLSIERGTARRMREAIRARLADRVSAERRLAEIRKALELPVAAAVARAFERWRLWDAASKGLRLTARARGALESLDRCRQALTEILREAGGRREPWEVRLFTVLEGCLPHSPQPLRQEALRHSRHLALSRAIRQDLLRADAARRARRLLARGRVRRWSTVDRYLRRLDAVHLAWLAAETGRDAFASRAVQWYVREGRRVRPELTGEDVLRLGCPPGPPVRRMLEDLRAARLDGRVAGRADEVAWVMRHLAGA